MLLITQCSKTQCWGFATVCGLIFSILMIWGIAPWESQATAERLAAGRDLFMHEWEIFDPLCAGGDGLGPVFNAKSCVACHFQGGVGGGGDNLHNVLTFEVDPDSYRRDFVTHVVHADAVGSQLLETQNNVRNLFQPIPNAIRVVNISGGGCDGPPRRTEELQTHDPVGFEFVNTPPLFGLGVIDELSDLSVTFANSKRLASRVAREFSGEFKGNGMGFVRVDEEGKIGKFGWKGQFATVEEFVAAACAMEIGLTNPRNSQPLPKQHIPDSAAQLDMTEDQLQDLVLFVKSLPVPQQVLPEDAIALERIVQGESFFNEVGCADCHVKSLGSIEGIYSDFHLYDLEAKFAIGGGSYGSRQENLDPKFRRPGSIPAPQFWKTPPLWGVADSAPYFHDGASPTLSSAIYRHKGQAMHTLNKFMRLKSDQRAMLIEFLDTLRAPGALRPETKKGKLPGNEKLANIAFR